MVEHVYPPMCVPVMKLTLVCNVKRVRTYKKLNMFYKNFENLNNNLEFPAAIFFGWLVDQILAFWIHSRVENVVTFNL